jgi:hypothetical protein
MKLSGISIVFMFIGMSWASAVAAASKRPTETIPLGIHLVELGDFDPKSSSFQANFWLWAADGVGFETIRYYLIINTIRDLYCDVLREFATTCDYAVTGSTPLIPKSKSYQNHKAGSRLKSCI